MIDSLFLFVSRFHPIVLENVDHQPTRVHVWNSQRSIDRGMIEEPSRFESLQVKNEWCTDTPVRDGNHFVSGARCVCKRQVRSERVHHPRDRQARSCTIWWDFDCPVRWYVGSLVMAVSREDLSPSVSLLAGRSYLAATNKLLLRRARERRITRVLKSLARSTLRVNLPSEVSHCISVTSIMWLSSRFNACFDLTISYPVCVIIVVFSSLPCLFHYQFACTSSAMAREGEREGEKGESFLIAIRSCRQR